MKNRMFLLAIILQLILPLAPVSAEEDGGAANPFAGAAPVDPDFNENESPLNQQNGFGFTAPAPQDQDGGGALPPSAAMPPNPPGNTPLTSEPVQRPNNRSRLAPPTGRSAVNPTPSPSAAQAAASKKKSEPVKLAEYLQLDSTVKGLEVKNFDLPDKELKDVVTLISKWTGKNFILDSKVRGKITIIGPSQVTLQEAYQAFLSALEANGLTTTQSGKFIRIIEAAEARRAPVKTYAGDYAPRDDQFITRIFQLRFINADEVQREFRDLVTRQGKLFAYEPTNSIIITDTGSNIQRIKEILDSLDVKTFETTLHILAIKNNSAKTVADMLGEIYGDDKGRPGQPRSFRKSALERTRGGGVITKIIPDETTNSLLVLANSAGFDQLRSLVQRLDVRASNSGKIHVYYCEHAKAEDLANTLASLSGGGGRSSSSRRTTTSGGPGGAPGGASPVSSGPISAELDGGVKITADPPTNSLVVTANASDYKSLLKVIRKLDIPRLQVFVETAILEVNLDTKTKVGVNLAIGAPGKVFAGGFIGDSDTLKSAISNGLPSEGATIPILVGDAWTSKTNIAGTETNVTVNTLNGILNLLTQTANTTVLSTPQILALDNEKAEFQVLDDTPVVAGTTALANSSNITQNVERLKTGIVIKLTPHVNAASNTIRLEIEQKVDSAKDASTVPAALKDSNRALTSRVTNTSVVVKDGDYLMMGGLMSDKIDETVSKVPLLGDIPILGWLFKSKSYKALKTNLIILLHPKVIGTSTAAADQIKKSLGKRKEFIEENFSGDDEVKKGVDEIEQTVDTQLEKSDVEPSSRYRNNEDEDEEPAVTTPQSKSTPPPAQPLAKPGDPNLGVPEIPQPPLAGQEPPQPPVEGTP